MNERWLKEDTCISRRKLECWRIPSFTQLNLVPLHHPAPCCTKNRQTLGLRIAGYQSSFLGLPSLGFPVLVRSMHPLLRVLVRVTELIICVGGGYLLV